MRRIFTLLLLGMAMLAWADNIPESEVKTADPFVMLDGDTYYCYGTRAGNPNKGFEAFSSKDLKTWKREGYVIQTGHNLYWAPEVYKFDGKYYMYYSANHKLYVAVADSPLGPFQDVTGTPMVDFGKNTIDNTVFTDTLEDGRVEQWMFFVVEDGQNIIYRCKLNPDHVTVDASTIVKVFGANQAYEKKVGYKCTEGPIVVKAPKPLRGKYRYYLCYSANTYNSPYYCVCYAYTTDIAGNQWTKYTGNPILSYDKDPIKYQVYGPGHHGHFYDKEGKLRIMFHGYKTAKCEGTRRVYIGTMKATSTKIEMDTDDPVISPKLYMGGYDVCDSTATAVQVGTSVCADLTNNGYKDMIFAGKARDGFLKYADWKDRVLAGRANDAYWNTTMLFDPATKKWTTKANGLKTMYRPVVVPCDINMDGNIDVITFDTLGISSPATTTAEALAREGLFLGDGEGNFTRQELKFVDKAGNPTTFNMIAPLAADVADFNNDGLPDIVLAGFRNNVQNANVVLINQGDFTFKVHTWDVTHKFISAVLAAHDFNNDGLTDFIVSGNVNNGSAPYVAIYMGNAAKPGTFTVRSVGNLAMQNLANGTVLVGDINNDGWLDIFLQGSSGKMGDVNAFRQHVYLNKKSQKALAFAADKNTDAELSGNSKVVRIQNSTPTSGGIIDWDGDGQFDVVVAGRTEYFQTQLGYLYRNVDGHLKQDCVVSGGSASTVAFPDWDGDGVKDYYNAGYSTDDLSFDTDYKGIRSTIYLNKVTEAPARPDCPTMLAADGKAGAVTLSWTPATTALDNTTYEIFVKNAEGKLITQTLSHIGGSLDGVRKVNRLGAMGCNKKITLSLPEGSYTWGVQAINAAYDGSEFATAKFDVTAGAVTGIDAPVHQSVRVVALYDVRGQRVDANTKGLVIAKYSDGTVKKIVIR